MDLDDLDFFTDESLVEDPYPYFEQLRSRCPVWRDRDPSRFTQPSEFKIDRPNVREHIAFGRGIHSCPGGSLARTEARISVERVLDRMADIRICEVEHGPADSRRFAYDPTYILRGIRSLHLEYRPIT